MTLSASDVDAIGRLYRRTWPGDAYRSGIFDTLEALGMLDEVNPRCIDCGTHHVDTADLTPARFGQLLAQTPGPCPDCVAERIRVAQ